MSFVDPTGRPCNSSVPGREIDEPGRADTRAMSNRDRLASLGNPYFLAFLRRMGREFADGDEAALAAVERLTELVAEPWHWQKEFEQFLQEKKI